MMRRSSSTISNRYLQRRLILVFGKMGSPSIKNVIDYGKPAIQMDFQIEKNLQFSVILLFIKLNSQHYT